MFHGLCLFASRPSFGSLHSSLLDDKNSERLRSSGRFIAELFPPDMPIWLSANIGLPRGLEHSARLATRAGNVFQDKILPLYISKPSNQFWVCLRVTSEVCSCGAP